MMLLGETWDAARARAEGLVSRVVPAGALDAAAREVAMQLAANVRAASVATKRLTLRSGEPSFRRFLTDFVKSQRRCWADPETRATLARYRAGRWSSPTRG